MELSALFKQIKLKIFLFQVEVDVGVAGVCFSDLIIRSECFYKTQPQPAGDNIKQHIVHLCLQKMYHKL